MTDPKYLTPEQIADELGVSLRTVYRRLAEMGAVRIGTALRVSRLALNRWIERQRVWPDSFAEEASGTPGSPSEEAAPARSPRSARTSARPRSAPPNSSARRWIRPPAKPLV